MLKVDSQLKPVICRENRYSKLIPRSLKNYVIMEHSSKRRLCRTVIRIAGVAKNRSSFGPRNSGLSRWRIMGLEKQLYARSNRCVGCRRGAKIVFGGCSKVDRIGVFRASAPGEFRSQRFIVRNAMKLFSRKIF